MKCYYHQTVDAVALCKSCSRALCAECISEVGLSCSCRNRCEADVATLNDLVQRGRSAYQKASANQFRSALSSRTLCRLKAGLRTTAKRVPFEFPCGFGGETGC